jgi:hypothetical protein
MVLKGKNILICFKVILYIQYLYRTLQTLFNLHQIKKFFSFLVIVY